MPESLACAIAISAINIITRGIAVNRRIVAGRFWSSQVNLRDFFKTAGPEWLVDGSYCALTLCRQNLQAGCLGRQGQLPRQQTAGIQPRTQEQQGGKKILIFCIRRFEEGEINPLALLQIKTVVMHLTLQKRAINRPGLSRIGYVHG
jgi:hypothetical protein